MHSYVLLYMPLQACAASPFLLLLFPLTDIMPLLAEGRTQVGTQASRHAHARTHVLRLPDRHPPRWSGRGRARLRGHQHACL